MDRLEKDQSAGQLKLCSVLWRTRDRAMKKQEIESSVEVGGRQLSLRRCPVN